MACPFLEEGRLDLALEEIVVEGGLGSRGGSDQRGKREREPDAQHE
jgi:hypothetical protein